MTEFLDVFLSEISRFIYQEAWFSPLIAIFAGVVTGIMPCTLASVPLVMGYVGGTTDRGLRKSFVYSLWFSLGVIVVTTALGITVALLNRMLAIQTLGSWWYLILGVVMLLMALQVWEVIRVVPATNLMGRSTKKGAIGALIAGFLGGLFSSPCSTPILIAILIQVSHKGDLLWGGYMLLLYSIGHSVIFIIAGTFTGGVKTFMRTRKYQKISELIKYGSGFILLLIGLSLIYLGL